MITNNQRNIHTCEMNNKMYFDETISDGAQKNITSSNDKFEDRNNHTSDAENTTEMETIQIEEDEEKDKNVTKSDLQLRNEIPVPSWLNLNKKPQTRQGTITDSSPIFPCNSDDKFISSKENEENKVNEVVERDSNEYNMNHKYRGKCIILNQEKFAGDKNLDREGTTYDVESLKSLTELLGFKIAIHHNLTVEKIKELMKEVSEEDHSENDCICVFVLSHGDNNRIAAADYYYDDELLWTPFTADKCPSLAGKPKLFFIQACRGEKYDSGIQVRSVLRTSRTETDSSSLSYKMPTYADFLIAYSTASGFVSFRETNKGTWYIQTLCEAIKEHYQTKDLLEILTITARRVALNFVSDSDHYEKNNQTQIPSFISLLTRNIHLKPKKL